MFFQQYFHLCGAYISCLYLQLDCFSDMLYLHLTPVSGAYEALVTGSTLNINFPLFLSVPCVRIVTFAHRSFSFKVFSLDLSITCSYSFTF